MNDCPFCNASEPTIKENTHARVILSNPRKVPGHTLVIPKRHIEKPWELEPAEIKSIYELIYSVEQKLVGKLGEGCDIRQNYRPFLRQNQLKVDHVHFHIIPRTLEDYIYQVSGKFESDLFAALDEKEREEVSKLLGDN